MRKTWLATCAAIACMVGVVLALGPRPEPAPQRSSTAAAVLAAPASNAREAILPEAELSAPRLDPTALAGVYRISFEHRLELGETPLLALSGNGRLDVSLTSDPAGYRLAQRYRFEQRTREPESAPQLPAELGFAADVDTQGALRRLGLPTGDAGARNFARALWDAVDVRWPNAPDQRMARPVLSASARGDDSFSLTVSPNGSTLTRTRRLTELHDGTPLSGGGELQLSFERGRLHSLSGSERTTLETPDGLLVAWTEVHWTRVGDAADGLDAALEWEHEPRYEAAPAVEAPARELPTLLQALERAVRVGPERDVLPLFDELALRLAQHPDEVEAVLRAIRDGALPLAMQRTLVDALGTSATPAAQRGLLELLDEQRPGLDGNLYLALGDQRAPLSETSARLGADAQRTSSRGAWARVAAGIQLARADAAPGELRAALLASLERGAPLPEVIEALAQSGDPAVLELIEAHSSDPTLRATAAEALRNVHAGEAGDEAERRLLLLAADSWPSVARAALDAFELRPATGPALELVAERLGDPQLHGDAHRALRSWSEREATPAALRAQIETVFSSAPPCTCSEPALPGAPSQGDPQ